MLLTELRFFNAHANMGEWGSILELSPAEAGISVWYTPAGGEKYGCESPFLRDCSRSADSLGTFNNGSTFGGSVMLNTIVDNILQGN